MGKAGMIMNTVSEMDPDLVELGGIDIYLI